MGKKDPHIKEKVTQIEKLRDDGLSMRAAARKIGITIGQLAGIAHREGIKFNSNSGPKKTTKKKPPLTKKTKVVKQPENSPKKENFLFPLSVQTKECCWPFGDPRGKNFHKCEKIVVRESYCLEHWNLAHKAPSAKTWRIFKFSQ